MVFVSDVVHVDVMCQMWYMFRWCMVFVSDVVHGVCVRCGACLGEVRARPSSYE